MADTIGTGALCGIYTTKKLKGKVVAVQGVKACHGNRNIV
jgi:hypothetical protein